MSALGADLLHAAMGGATSVLPLSPDGHRVALEIWFEGDGHLDHVLAMGQVATGLALLVFTRARLAQAMAAGLRGLARPALLQDTEAGRDAVAIVVGAVAAAILSGFLAPPMVHNRVPLVAAAGFLVTALGLVSTAWAPKARGNAPSLGAGLVAGLAHGLAVVPGLSATAAAFVVLRWSSVRRWAAAELALLIACPVYLLNGSRHLLEASGHLPETRILVGSAVAAFGAATLAAVLWRTLCERQATVFVGVWLATLALSAIAYDRALPAPAEALPIEAQASSDRAGIRTDPGANVLGSPPMTLRGNRPLAT